MASSNLQNLLLETSPNISFLSWVIWVSQGEFIQIVYITKVVEMWWSFKNFVNYSWLCGFPQFTKFRETQLFSRNLTDFVNYSKSYNCCVQWSTKNSGDAKQIVNCTINICSIISQQTFVGLEDVFNTSSA